MVPAIQCQSWDSLILLLPYKAQKLLGKDVPGERCVGVAKQPKWPVGFFR